MPVRPFLLKITGPAGQRREIPRGTLLSVSYNDEQDGGQTSCTIETSVDLNALPTVSNGDVITCFVRHLGQNELRYYGKIVRGSISQEDGISRTLTGRGESSDIGKIMLNREVMIPGPPDISTLWSVLADEVRLKRPDIFVQSTPTGLVRSSIEAFYVKFGDATRDLMQSAGNRAGWGVRRQVLPPHTPVLSLDRCARAGDSIDLARTVALPSRAVGVSDGDSDATDIRNIVYLRGGVPANPNLIPNADFRLTEFAGAQWRNLLKNASFENGGVHGVDDWGLLNGASKKMTGFSEGPSHSGDYMVELDNATETIACSRQDVSSLLVPNDVFRVECYARREIGAGTSVLGIELYWQIADGTEVAGEGHDFTITDAIWQNYGFLITCPDTFPITGFRMSLIARTPSIVVDDANFYDTSLIVPRFMETRYYGTASIVSLHYTQTVIRHPYRSAYAPELAIKGTLDLDGNDAHFGLRCNQFAGGATSNGENVFFDVSGNMSLRIMVDLISPRTPNGSVYKSGKFFLEVHWRKSDGSNSGSRQRFAINPSSGFSVWNQFAFTATAPGDAAKAIAFLCFRGAPTYSGAERTALGITTAENGISRIIVGAFSARAAGGQPQEVAAKYVGLPALPGVQYEWIPDGPYQNKFLCTDVMPFGSPEYLSIETYGESPSSESQDSITTQEEAIAFVEAIFTAYAVERPNGSFTLQGDTRQFNACTGIRLRGKRGRMLASSVVAIKRVTYTYDGDHTQNIVWGLDPDDPYEVLTSLIASENKTGGSGAGAGYYGSSGPSAGGGSGGGTSAVTSFWGESPRTFDDDTLHDDYAPVDGPHVLPAERLHWQAAYDEVTAALTSAYYSTTYPHLDDRLEYIEARSGWNWRGVWSGATAYVLRDAVFHDGSSYFCILAHTNHEPGVGGWATYWDLIAQKGDDGAAGATGADGNPRIIKLGGATQAGVDTINFGTGFSGSVTGTQLDLTATGGGGGSVTAVTIATLPAPATLGLGFYVTDDGLGALVMDTGTDFQLQSRTKYPVFHFATTGNGWSYIYNNPASTYTNVAGTVTLDSGTVVAPEDSLFASPAVGGTVNRLRYVFKIPGYNSTQFAGPNYNRYSIGFRNSTNTNSMVICTNANAILQVLIFTGNFGGISQPVNTPYWNVLPGHIEDVASSTWYLTRDMFVAITYNRDANTMLFEISPDQINWLTVYTSANPLGAAPDQAIAMVGNGNIGGQSAQLKIYGVSTQLNYH